MRLILFLLTVVIGVVCASELYVRHEVSGIQITGSAIEEARNLKAQGYFDDARLLAEFAVNYPEDENEKKVAEYLVTQIDNESNLDEIAASFLSGAVSGEPKDLAGFLGSLTLDLFVVGDIRDLTVQGYREISAGDGDMLILSLSAVGLATTLTPQLDFAPALLKLFRRAGALGERFVKSVSKIGRKALASGDYARLTRVVTDFGRSARKLGPAPLSRIMKHVDDPAKLGRIARAADKSPAATFSLIHLTGGKSIKLLTGTGENVSRLSKVLTRGSRGLKILDKATSTLNNSQLKWILGVVIVIMLFQIRRFLSPLIRTARI